MTDARALAGRLRSGERQRLLFVKMPSPAEVELAAVTGFDAVILDTEHGTSEGLEHHLRAADAAGIPALVRVPAVDPAAILRALDGGATGVVVAHVADAAQARAAVAAAHYPPRGRRGLALTTRAGRYGAAELTRHLERAETETLVVVQIEDAEAVDHAESILAVEGVDAVLIGATDLSISLGHPGGTKHPRVSGAIDEIKRAAAACGVPVGTVVSTGDEAEEAQSEGAPLAVFVASLLVRDALSAVTGSTVPAGVPRRPADQTPGPAGPEPLILLPGMLGTAALWDRVAPQLREVTPIHLGRIDLDASVDEMAESILAAAPDRFSLAGHSLGGIVALAVIRRAPGRVGRLALLNTSALPATPEQLGAWDGLEEAAHEQPFADVATGFARGSMSTGEQGDDGIVEQVAAMARECGPRVLLRQLQAQRSRPDARPGLAAIRAPTLVLSGDNDTVSPPARQDELAKEIPDAQLVRLAGVGHYSPLEAPEQVTAALAGWLA